MKLKHHIFRVVASLVVIIAFCKAVTVTESNFWLLIEVLGFMGLCGLIIAIDHAHEIDDENMEL